MQTNRFEQDDLNKAVETVKEKLPDSSVRNDIIFRPHYKAKVRRDFTKYSLKRARVFLTTFTKSLFNGVVATGSQFQKNNFYNCDFSGANFQFCFFYKSFWGRKSLIKGANFSHSTFIDCVFDEITLTETTMYDCVFEGCYFRSSIIITNTFENSTFENCIFEHIDLSINNLEYIIFENIKLQYVILPPYQVPYIIGAPVALYSLMQNNNYIYTDRGAIPINDYCDLYNELALYFYSKKEFFPLANLLIAIGHYDKAYRFLLSGIKEAMDFSDFRLVKHYCRLARSTPHFDRNQLKVLFENITDFSYSASWDVHTLHSYMINIGAIKELLLNNDYKSEHAEIIIKTGIGKDDIKAVNNLYQCINNLIKSYCSELNINSIEIRHNSPYEFYIMCIDALPNVLLIISAVYSVLLASSKCLDFIKKIEDVIGVHLQNKLTRYEIEEKRLEIQMKLAELKKNTSTASLILPNSIIDIEHSLQCSSSDLARTMPSECIHYKIKNKK